MKLKTLACAAAMLAFTAMPSKAAVVQLNFEGIGDQQPVGNYYAGQGVEFSPATLALVDADAGGSGNFANEPSPNTIMFFLDANEAILNFAAGFTTGFSFFYTSSTEGSVSVWDDVNGTGNLLGSISILANAFNGCPGDPNGPFNCFDIGSLLFNGTAKSINFGGTANQTGYDNITFGSGDPTTSPVPVPAALPLLLTGLGAIGGLSLRRRAKSA